MSATGHGVVIYLIFGKTTKVVVGLEPKKKPSSNFQIRLTFNSDRMGLYNLNHLVSYNLAFSWFPLIWTYVSGKRLNK